MITLNANMLKENIAMLMKKNGTTQQTLANEIGMSQANLSGP